MVLKRLVSELIPALDTSLHKGSCGKIGIIGGCKQYTGAPYYAAISVLKSGADLSHVFCSGEAALPLKSYSPELIVHPVLVSEESLSPGQDRSACIQSVAAGVAAMFPRLDALVIGPGLGRDPLMLDCVEQIITRARGCNLPMVIDGDGLFLLSERAHLVQGYPRVVLTPNLVEFRRLVAAVCPEVVASEEDGEQGQEGDELLRLCRTLGHVTVIQKGPIDRISDGRTVIACEDEGSPRRCGGQGDVLAGMVGTFLGWASKRDPERTATTKNMVQQQQQQKQKDPSDFMLAAFGACTVTRKSGRMAFAHHRRSTTTPDIIACVGPAFEAVFPCSSSL